MFCIKYGEAPGLILFEFFLLKTYFNLEFV